MKEKFGIQFGDYQLVQVIAVCSSLGFCKLRTQCGLLDLSVAFILISDALSINPGFGQTRFSVVTLCPFKVKSFSKQMLSSSEGT